MTRIDFYFNLEDKLRHLVQLAESAVQRRRRLFVLTPDVETTERLEALLWAHNPTAFLPHCRASHPLAAETPIVLDWQLPDAVHDDVLVNLHAQQPTCFSRFRGLIELVGREDEDRAAARARFRFYRDRGYALKSHDVAGGG